MTNLSRVGTRRDFACDAPARLDRAPRLEGAIASLPDDAVAVLRLKVHAIELLQDVLHFMRDELRGVQRRFEVHVRGDQRAVLTPQNGAGFGRRRRTRKILDEHAHAHTGSGRKPAPLAPERRRRLPHLVEKGSKNSGNVEVRRQDDWPDRRSIAEARRVASPRRLDELMADFATAGYSAERLSATGDEYARQLAKHQKSRGKRYKPDSHGVPPGSRRPP